MRQRHLTIQPYDYQREGIAFAAGHERVIIGDEPGLGKTLQSIGAVVAAAAFPCLVICPSSLKENWRREWQKCSDAQPLVLSSSSAATFGYLLQTGVYDVAVTNYESLRRFFVLQADRKAALASIVFQPSIGVFRSVIIDESHRVKDPSAMQTKLAKGICTGKRHVILLTGTPVVNAPDDLLAQLSIMGRLTDFGGARAFRARYCGGDPDNGKGRGKQRRQPANLDELSRRLYASCLIRRAKADVLPQLPDKTRAVVPATIANADIYALAAADLRAYLLRYTECDDRDIRRKMRMRALVQFMTLRSLATMGKVTGSRSPAAIDFIRTFLASGKKLIVFCSLHEAVDALLQAFPTALTVTGRDSTNAKQTAVDNFQQDPARQLIICAVKAAGVGLTLTAASAVLFIELPWTYADCCQCEDRAHRIGQRDNVTCYYLLASGTVDQTVYSVINEKKSVAAQIMGCDDNIPSSREYFDQLMQAFLSKQPLNTTPP